MTDRSAAMAAWTAAGTELVMLPSTVEVRIDLPSVYSLISTGQMPGYLRALAIKVGEDDATELTDDEKAKWDDFERLLVSKMVVAFKPPGMEETPGRITLEDLKADPCPIPRDDYIALRDMALRIRTPTMVDAFSRLSAMHTDLRLDREKGLDDPEVIAEREAAIKAKAEEVGAIIESEMKDTVEGWATFRDLGRGSLDRVQREDVGMSTVNPAGDNRAIRRARSRRRAAPAGTGRAERAAKPAKRKPRTAAARDAVRGEDGSEAARPRRRQGSAA